MPYWAWIVILLLAIGTFVAAYFASRTWHWTNVTLMVLVFLSTILYVVLEADVVRIRAVYGKQIVKLDKELTDYTERNRALENGTQDSQVLSRLKASEVRVPDDPSEFKSIRFLDHNLHLRTRLRGRVWRNTAPAGPYDAENGTQAVQVESPKPHAIDPNTIVYLFEQGNPSGGPQYLGEFHVAEATPDVISLKSVSQLDNTQLNRINASQGPWVIYESMPVDEHQPFEQFTDEQLAQLLPAESVAEYIKHGGEPTADDDEWHLADFDDTGQMLGPESAEGATTEERYQRALRDYSYLFQEMVRDRVSLLAETSAVEKDNEKLATALTGGKQLEASREEVNEKLDVDLAGTKKDRNVIEKLLAALQNKVQTGRKLFEDTLHNNRQRADELARKQQALREWIDQQTKAEPAANTLGATP